MGSWYRRLDIHRWTSISNTGKVSKEIDHMLARNRKEFLTYRIYRGVECPANTDHRLVVARIALQFSYIKRREAVTGVKDATYHLITLKRKAVVAEDHVERNRLKRELGGVHD